MSEEVSAAELAEIQELYERARRAFEQIEFWPQDKVDEMVAAVAWEWQREATAKELARLAVDESGIGVYEDKVAKIQSKTRGTLWDMNGVKTCGLVEEDKERGLRIYAKPMGVIANIVPSTNPESTVCCIGLSLLKTRNAMIVSPHPKTQGSSYLTVEHGRKALRKVGAPEDLMLCVKNSSRAKARELMAGCDFVVATGGAALVQVVYAAGKPCHTVSSGNVISIVDETADLKAVAAKIVKSKVANNSASCSSENAVALEASIYEEMMEFLQAEGGYLCNSEQREKLRALMWPDGKMLERGIVAKTATYIAEQAGIDVPEGTRFLMVLGEKIGPEDRFSGEKVSPVLTVWKWNEFSEMVERMKAIHRFSGEGHSASIHSERDDRKVELAIKANVGRVNCNMPHAMANSGSWFNANPFTDTLGGGSWAGNMTSENIHWKHFLNYTWLSEPFPAYVPTDEDLFGDYLAKWGQD
ncbi:MAG: aldehyde dehydrogenase family protein [Chloroflexi bacterium]|nr:aldehyde dehydrogenase family protein [Chloroflexota bacterium]MCI0771823.1 aldehyde dehydrogenase family protein [Chloroflexota bacterium]MCI0806936.1 aldehyde dehydrogenase family protein [Chloroflexota bacterium]MCI0826245.1 aldehyde dehydrogenase family protein [Chloroflexota bacterium]MCI0861554.1 aldehyde dehydrogenase family protein [Chloroflexota bacterium]